MNVGKANLHEFAYGVTSQNLHYGVVPNPRTRADCGRLERRLGGRARARRRRRCARDRHRRLDPDPRRVLRDRRASSRPTGSSRRTASSRSRRASTTPARWRATSQGCVELVGLEPPELALSDLSVAAAWVDGTGRRVRGVDFPTAEAVGAGVHARGRRRPPRALRRARELYGENIRAEDRALPGGHGRRVRVGDSRRAPSIATRAEEAARGSTTLLVTPTLSCPAPPADCVEIEVRGAMTLFTFPFNALGWPAPRGRRRCRSSGGRAPTRSCSARAWPLERALAVRR